MKQIALSKLKPNERNPREISQRGIEDLKESILDNPHYKKLLPVVCDENFVVLSGNQRLKAFTELGLQKIPVLFFTTQDYEEAVEARQERGTYQGESKEELAEEFMLRANTHAGTWNHEMLMANWEEDQLKAWNVPVMIPYSGTSDEDNDNRQETGESSGSFQLIVTCSSAQERNDLLLRLEDEGYEVDIAKEHA